MTYLKCQRVLKARLKDLISCHLGTQLAKNKNCDICDDFVVCDTDQRDWK